MRVSIPFVVGLTGGIGSGKSAAAAEFGRLGAEVIDTDAIAHELTAPGGAAIAGVRGLFGDQVIGPDGAMDRVKMRAKVFADAGARIRLETFLHPLIREESQRRIAAARSPYVIHMVPLLVEARNYRGGYERIAVVDCPEEMQVRRVVSRGGIAEDEVRRIMAAQVPRAVRLAAADDVIDNGGPPDALRKQVQDLHSRYLEFAQK